MHSVALQELVQTSGLKSLSPRRKYLVGVSGGVDSLVLLHALHAASFRQIVVCHLNHKLRPRAAKSERKLVESAAHRAGFSFSYGECDVREHASQAGLSVETAARDLRYRFFEQCAKQHRCQHLLLAHHADDQTETILHNLFRGTGLTGLSGMASTSQRGPLTVHRPFLAVPKNTLLLCAKAQNIAFREDPSNADLDHTRNRIRHLLTPALNETFSPSWAAAVLRLADIARCENACLDALVPPVPEQIPTEILLNLHPAVRRRWVLLWLKSRGVPEPGFAETERVLQLLLPGGKPAKINLPGGLHARRRAGRIFLEGSQ